MQANGRPGATTNDREVTSQRDQADRTTAIDLSAGPSVPPLQEPPLHEPPQHEPLLDEADKVVGRVPYSKDKPGLPKAADKPLGQLLGDLSKEMSLLVHEEVQLAKVELTEKAKQLGLAAALFAAAAVAGLLGAAALMACVVVALAIVLPWWLSALVVAAVLLGAAGSLAVVGLGRLQGGSPPVPEQAMESTKEDLAWVQKQLRSGRQ